MVDFKKYIEPECKTCGWYKFTRYFNVIIITLLTSFCSNMPEGFWLLSVCMFVYFFDTLKSWLGLGGYMINFNYESVNLST